MNGKRAIKRNEANTPVAKSIRVRKAKNEPTLDLPCDPLAPEFAVGDWVREKHGQQVFRVTGFNKDGSLALYGGTKNPKGHRGYRAIMPDRLVPAASPYGDREGA